jgi:hypothetical protein
MIKRDIDKWYQYQAETEKRLAVTGKRKSKPNARYEDDDDQDESAFQQKRLHQKSKQRGKQKAQPSQPKQKSTNKKKASPLTTQTEPNLPLPPLPPLPTTIQEPHTEVIPLSRQPIPLESIIQLPQTPASANQSLNSPSQVPQVQVPPHASDQSLNTPLQLASIRHPIATRRRSSHPRLLQQNGVRNSFDNRL